MLVAMMSCGGFLGAGTEALVMYAAADCKVCDLGTQRSAT